LKPGNRVLARSEDTGTYAFEPITQVFLHEDPVKVHLTLEDPATGATEVIETTPEHPFHVSGRGFVPAGSLKPDDAVSRGAAATLSVVRLIPGQSGTSEVLRVKNLTFEKRPFLAYDLNVGQDHTFFVGAVGAWVHNCDPLPPGEEPYQLKLFPLEAFDRDLHYGKTPTPAQQRAVPPGMSYDHVPPLVRHYYEKQPSGYHGYNLTQTERLQFSRNVSLGRAATQAPAKLARGLRIGVF
jgi:hypothetical protein